MTYRIWFADGSAILENGRDAPTAKQKAWRRVCEHVAELAMDDAERQEACRIVKVENLTKERR